MSLDAHLNSPSAYEEFAGLDADELDAEAEAEAMEVEMRIDRMMEEAGE